MDFLFRAWKQNIRKPMKSLHSVKLYFLGSKITADGDRSHEIKRRLLLGRKVMTNLDNKIGRASCRERV